VSAPPTFAPVIARLAHDNDEDKSEKVEGRKRLKKTVARQAGMANGWRWRRCWNKYARYGRYCWVRYRMRLLTAAAFNELL